ncbi:MAG: type 1 glutamine amidotransferase [Alcanivoracaceae bacterium]
MANIHVLQHVPFEDPGAMTLWLFSRDHRISTTHLYRGELPPATRDIDWLIIMGGPMGVHDGDQYPWLAAEKTFIRACIDEGKAVLGVCLGAQLIADVCGATVRRNDEVEIGWFPVSAVGNHPLASLFLDHPVVLHWHGDTFAIPDGAEHLCRSEACINQAFLLGERVLGLQFHLETTPEGLQALLDDCNHNTGEGHWIQNANSLLAEPSRFDTTHRLLQGVLTYIESTL